MVTLAEITRDEEYCKNNFADERTANFLRLSFVDIFLYTCLFSGFISLLLSLLNLKHLHLNYNFLLWAIILIICALPHLLAMMVICPITRSTTRLCCPKEPHPMTGIDGLNEWGPMRLVILKLAHFDWFDFTKILLYGPSSWRMPFGRPTTRGGVSPVRPSRIHWRRTSSSSSTGGQLHGIWGALNTKSKCALYILTKINEIRFIKLNLQLFMGHTLTHYSSLAHFCSLSCTDIWLQYRLGYGNLLYGM